jgi:hypothetical protein
VAVSAWVAGATPEIVVGAVAVSLIAFVLIVAWRKFRSGTGVSSGLNEDH